MDRLQLMMEADKRGFLPPDKKALLDEAVKRGLTTAPKEPGLIDQAKDVVKWGVDAVLKSRDAARMGAIKGAADIGATILSPLGGNKERRESLKGFFEQNADTESPYFTAGELGANVAGTAGIGGTLAKVPFVARYAPKLAAALQSGGMTLNAPAATTAMGKLANAATRVGAGTVVGGASAGLVNPENAETGAIMGAAFPVAAKAVSETIPKVSQSVADLYQKAKNLGIEIPADRLINSRPLNAVAASLNYVPLSGRAATEEKMVSQVNRALSRTFGQDSENVTLALRKAGTELGGKFDKVLSNNSVKVDGQFLNELVGHLQTATNELSDDGARIIGKQIDLILGKAGANGEIDGRAAYNIKKALDRIGGRNANEAYYARELKKSLMGALDRSLGPNEAAGFATVRKQYGNMLELESLAQNGAEGGISIGRLANLKNVNNPELQDIADIAAQFVKTRENPHGAQQRVILGALAAGAAGATGNLPLLAGTIGGGRLANMTLNNNLVKSSLINQNELRNIAASPYMRSLAYQAKPK